MRVGMRIRYTQWHDDDRWAVDDLERLVSKLAAEGWQVTKLSQSEDSRGVWLKMPENSSGIQIIVYPENMPV